MARTRRTYVALLRGINVGGNTMVKMAELKACFEAVGYERVKTYINSGNVVFQSNRSDARAIETGIEKALTAEFGHDIAVVVRSLPEMDDLLSNIPRSWVDNPALKCNVIFLRHTVDSAGVLDDLPTKAGIEELRYHPGALLWCAETSDLTRSNMVKLSRSPLYKQMTIRNLNTTRKVHALMQSAESGG